MKKQPLSRPDSMRYRKNFFTLFLVKTQTFAKTPNYRHTPSDRLLQYSKRIPVQTTAYKLSTKVLIQIINTNEILKLA